MEQVTILDVNIDTLGKEEILDRIKRWVNSKSKPTKMVVTVNAEMIMTAQKNDKFKTVVNTADLHTIDSAGVKGAISHKYKQALGVRYPGVDMIDDLAKISEAYGWRWYLLGGAPGIAKRAANTLKIRFPKINIVKADDGGIITEENISDQKDLVARINSYKPDILLVSFGQPKQELFIATYKNSLSASVAIGLGGTLDFLAGKQKRAPKFMRIIGLEWLYRLIREPKRFKRIWTALVLFPLAARKDKDDPKSIS